MTDTTKPPRKKRTPPAEPASMMIRIPTALKGVVQELNKVYREAKQRRPRPIEMQKDETTGQ